jgi:hypothetical protein
VRILCSISSDAKVYSTVSLVKGLKGEVFAGMITVAVSGR